VRRGDGWWRVTRTTGEGGASEPLGKCPVGPLNGLCHGRGVELSAAVGAIVDA
jgi:hypothetical protein